MRQEIWRGSNGELQLMKRFRDDTLLGYIVVEAPKKTVTKTVTLFDEWNLPAESIRLPYPVIPVGAKNVRLQFDVEE